MHYRHTQLGPAPLRFGVLVFLLSMTVILALGGEWQAAASTALVSVVVGTALFVFSRFTVEVTDESLTASFGWGWPRRTVRWEDVTAARPARNSWWYGFGIRWFPGGTLWNVWGLDAVELDLDRGKLRIGTDDLEALLAALAGRVALG